MLINKWSLVSWSWIHRLFLLSRLILFLLETFFSLVCTVRTLRESWNGQITVALCGPCGYVLNPAPRVQVKDADRRVPAFWGHVAVFRARLLFLFLLFLLAPTHAAFPHRNTSIAMETGNRDDWRRNEDRQRLCWRGLSSCRMHHVAQSVSASQLTCMPILVYFLLHFLFPASHVSSLGFIFIATTRQYWT